MDKNNVNTMIIKSDKNNKNNKIKIDKFLLFLSITLTISEVFNIIYNISSKIYISTDSIFRKIIMVIIELFFHLIIVIINIIGVKIILADLKLNRNKIKKYTRDKNPYIYLLKYIGTYIIPILILFILLFQISSSILEFPFLDNSKRYTLSVSSIMLLILIIFSAFDMDTVNKKFKIHNSIEEKLAKISNNIDIKTNVRYPCKSKLRKFFDKFFLYLFIIFICVSSKDYFTKVIQNVKTFTYEMEEITSTEKEKNKKFKEKIIETLDKLNKTLDDTGN